MGNLEGALVENLVQHQTCRWGIYTV